MENGRARMVATCSFSTRTTRSSLIFPYTSTTTSFTCSSLRYRNSFIIFFLYFRFLFLFFLGFNGNGGSSGSSRFRLLTVYFYTIFSNMRCLGSSGNIIGLCSLLSTDCSRGNGRFSWMTTKSTTRKSKEFIKVGYTLLTTRPTL